MADRKLTLRELNRATLARQMLLERADVSAPEGIERLVGMQAQLAVSPYIGLWTRLRDFRREDLARAIEERAVVKATLMRSTLHLFTSRDYISLRGAIQPALDDASQAIRERRGGRELDIDEVVDVARRFIAEKPRTFAELSAMLSEWKPDTDIGAMRYSVRTHLPMVQVPSGNGWSYPGNPQFTLAETWLGTPVSIEPTEEGQRTLLTRYLAAYGPASVADMQTWSGFPKLKDAVERLRPEFVTYRDEQGRELFDLPGMPLPDPETPAPERFLPEYDNLLLSHSKRTRVLADAYRSSVYLPGLRVRSTFLVDGFVAGGWKIEKVKGAATLVIEPFETLSKQSLGALTEEAERLVRFLESNAKSFAVRVKE